MRTTLPSRSTVLIVIGLLLAVVLVVATAGGPENSSDLDPTNPDRNGAKALAEVLGNQGVEVDVVRSADAFADAELGPDAAVVVTGADDLGRNTAEDLTTRTESTPVVVVGADFSAEYFDGISGPRSTSLTPGVAAGCPDPLLESLTLTVDRAIAYAGAPACFPAEGGGALVTRGERRFFGAAEALTNDQILRGDNAAIALRLLGQRGRLVWYVPDTADISADEAVGAADLLPDATLPLLFLAGLCGLALVLWRGRRLGPLAVEPLPVTVKAIETTHSRGRIYRKQGDRAHAAHTLRYAAYTKISAALGLGRGTVPVAVISRIAATTRRTEQEVEALLLGQTPPPDDRTLVHLANDLAALTEEVRKA